MSSDTATMSRPFGAVIGALSRCVRSAQTWRPKVSPAERFVRSLLLVPAFSILLAFLRIRSLLWGRPTVQGVTRSGDRFNCRPPDFVQMYVWLFGVWEPDVSDYIAMSLGAGDTFVDVGANIGVFSVLASRRVGAAGSVVAIEASPHVFRDLTDSLAMNGATKNVRAVNVAAGSDTSEVTVYAGPDQNTGLTTTVANRGFRREAIVKADRLDAILTEDEIQKVRLVKIDVEGGEPAVIAGMTGFLQRCRPDAEILIELSPHWWAPGTPAPSIVLEPLTRAGFFAYEIDNNYWPWRYVAPGRVRRPRRIRRDLDARIDRVDLVMSRLDRESL